MNDRLTTLQNIASETILHSDQFHDEAGACWNSLGFA